MESKGINAAAWFGGQSFHRIPDLAQAVNGVATDTRPRHNYVLPSGRTVAIICDHGQWPAARVSYSVNGEVVTAIRADLAERIGGGR